jgi:hypothetical protein
MKQNVMALVVLFCGVAGVVLVLGWMLFTALRGS